MEDISLFFAASVFGAGLLSFFSPCVLPVLPVYIGYLSGDAQTADTSKSPIYRKLLNTLVFVSGLSVTFFLLGLGAGLLGEVLNNSYFFIICGLIVFVFGLFHSGLVNIPLLNHTKKLEMPANVKKGTLLGAFLLGLVFSFAWTPCVGPILGSVLAISAQQGGALTGGGLLLIYSLGLGIPFFVIAAASGFLLRYVKTINKHMPKIKLAGGLVIAVAGLYMVFSQVRALENIRTNYPIAGQEKPMDDNGVNFTLLDLNGNTVNLSDYRGMPVYIKFWATWCPFCLAGLEEFSAIAREYNESGSMSVLSIVAPGFNGEMSEQRFTDWANGQQLDFPILFDSTGNVNRQFGLRAYPTSVFINEKGEVLETRIGDMGTGELRSKLDSLLPT